MSPIFAGGYTQHGTASAKQLFGAEHATDSFHGLSSFSKGQTSAAVPILRPKALKQVSDLRPI